MLCDVVEVDAKPLVGGCSVVLVLDLGRHLDLHHDHKVDRVKAKLLIGAWAFDDPKVIAIVEGAPRRCLFEVVLVELILIPLQSDIGTSQHRFDAVERGG